MYCATRHLLCQLSVRNWPPPLPQRVATESGGLVLGMAREEDRTGEGKGGVQLAMSSMNRELTFARAWSMTHAVELSALSAVD